MISRVATEIFNVVSEQCSPNYTCNSGCLAMQPVAQHCFLAILSFASRYSNFPWKHILAFNELVCHLNALQLTMSCYSVYLVHEHLFNLHSKHHLLKSIKENLSEQPSLDLGFCTGVFVLLSPRGWQTFLKKAWWLSKLYHRLSGAEGQLRVPIASLSVSKVV